MAGYETDCLPQPPDGVGQSGSLALTVRHIAVAVTLLAFGLRVVALDLESLWFDTSHSGALALNPSLDAVLRGAAADFQSPLYFVLVHLWLAVAQGDFWLAFPSAAAGTLIVPLAFVTGRRLFTANAGLIAAGFCAITTYQVYYSRYPRGYILLAFLALLAAYWLHRALIPARSTTSRWTPWLAHLGAAIAAIYTQPYAFFIMAAMWGCAGLYALVRTPRSLPALVGVGIAAGLAYLPWLGSTWSQITGVKAGADAWIEPVSRDSLKTLWDWLWFKTRAEYHPLVDVALRAGRYLMTAVMAAALWPLRFQFGLWFTLALVAGPVVVAFAFSVAVVSLWDARYLVSVSPVFALWLGGAVTSLPHLIARLPLPSRVVNGAPLAAAGLLAIMAIPPLTSLYGDAAYRAADLRGAMTHVHRGYQPGDAILHTNYQSYLPALWYDHVAGSPGDGPHPAPCVWASLPPAWCQGSPYREAYVNPALTTFAEGARDIRQGWLVVLYNHNRTGDAEAQLAEARGHLASSGLRVAGERQFSGVYVLRIVRSP